MGSAPPKPEGVVSPTWSLMLGTDAPQARRQSDGIDGFDVTICFGIEVMNVHLATSFGLIPKVENFPSVYFFASCKVQVRMVVVQIRQRPGGRELTPQQPILQDHRLAHHKFPERAAPVV